MSSVADSGDQPEREFEADGEPWRARAAGAGLAGWGERGTAPVEAVQFYRPGESRPRYEALIGRGRLPYLHEAELVTLLRRATPVPPGS